MEKRVRKHYNLMGQEGFTLIELLLVVIILGILAAVVLPQFSTSSNDAKLSALKSNVATIRQALELYSVQHNSTYPDISDDAQDFVDKLTLFSKADGSVSATDRANYPFGPYIKNGMPPNPFVDGSADMVYVYTGTADGIGTFNHAATGGEGWYYKINTGEFVANDDTYDEY